MDHTERMESLLVQDLGTQECSHPTWPSWKMYIESSERWDLLMSWRQTSLSDPIGRSLLCLRALSLDYAFSFLPILLPSFLFCALFLSLPPLFSPLFFSFVLFLSMVGLWSVWYRYIWFISLPGMEIYGFSTLSMDCLSIAPDHDCTDCISTLVIVFLFRLLYTGPYILCTNLTKPCSWFGTLLYFSYYWCFLFYCFFFCCFYFCFILAQNCRGLCLVFSYFVC